MRILFSIFASILSANWRGKVLAQLQVIPTDYMHLMSDFGQGVGKRDVELTSKSEIFLKHILHHLFSGDRTSTRPIRHGLLPNSEGEHWRDELKFFGGRHLHCWVHQTTFLLPLEENL